MRRFVLLAAAIALCACDHTVPYTITDPGPLGPVTDTLPRRLTFNVGVDRDPSSSTDGIVYTQFPAGRADRDGCLGYLPPAGGTLSDLQCPGGTKSDDRQDSWLSPTLSAGGRVAYVWEQAEIGGIVPNDRVLRIAAADQPDSVLFEKSVFFSLPGGERVLAIRDLLWDDTGRLRFVAGVDSYSVNLGIWDTTFVALTLATLDPSHGEYEPVSGTDGALAHLSAPDAGVWFVSAAEPARLKLRAAAGGVTVVGMFAQPVARLGLIDGFPAGISSAGDSTTVEWIDPVTGAAAGVYKVGGRANAIAGVPGTRHFVLDLERGTTRDLWLFELPR